MDTGTLGRGAMIAGVSGVLLFIFMFFGWFGAPDAVDEAVEQAQQAAEALGVETPNLEEADTSANAWESFDFIDLILLLAVLVSVGLAAMTLAGSSASLPVAGSALTCGIGALAFLLVLLPGHRSARGRRARDRALARPARDGGHRRGRLSRHAGGGNLLRRTGGPAQEASPGGGSSPGRPARAGRPVTLDPARSHRVLTPARPGRVAFSAAPSRSPSVIDQRKEGTCPQEACRRARSWPSSPPSRWSRRCS